MTHHTASTQEDRLAGPADQILGFLHEVLRPLPDPTSRRGGIRGRPRDLSADHLSLAMLVAILRGFTGVAQVWRLISWTGVQGFALLSLTRGAVRKRLLTEDLSGWQALLVRVSAALVPWTAAAQDSSLAPFAHTILDLDQSTLDAVRRTSEDVGGEAKDSARLLVGKLAGLFDIRRQQWVRVLFRDDVFANEKLFVHELLAGIEPGALLLADLGYFSFAWFDWLTDHGYFWLSRMREKTSYQVVHVFGEQGSTLDALIWLGAYNADKAKHLVRLMQFEHAGTCYRYVTNVRDPGLLSMSDAARLYARRWDIELAFKTLKRELGVHLWWSSTPILVLHQLLAAFILAQIVHALHLRVAASAGVDLFEVSLPVLVTLIAQAPARATGESLLDALLRTGRQQGLIRPSRRYQPVVPALLEPPRPAPPDLVCIRKERYAQRKCTPRSHRSCFQPRFFSFFLI